MALKLFWRRKPFTPANAVNLSVKPSLTSNVPSVSGFEEEGKHGLERIRIYHGLFRFHRRNRQPPFKRSTKKDTGTVLIGPIAAAAVSQMNFLKRLIYPVPSCQEFCSDSFHSTDNLTSLSNPQMIIRTNTFPQDMNPTASEDKHVSFSCLSIREYALIIGDNPSCSSGVPTALGWDHTDDITFDIDCYENHRGPRRSIPQLKMGSNYRRELLCENEPELNEHLHRVERRLYRERRKSKLNKFFAPPKDCECDNNISLQTNA